MLTSVIHASPLRLSSPEHHWRALGLPTPGASQPRARAGKEENPLVVMGHFTCYAQAYVTQSQTALTTAKALWGNFIIHYGLPEKILLDQERNFESELIAGFFRLMGTKKLRTSLYHPQTNDQHERFNSTLIGMLGTLPPECKSNWKGSIGPYLQLHPELCHRLQSIFPHAWKTTPSPH